VGYPLVPTLPLGDSDRFLGCAAMLAIAMVWLICAAIILELADRAPTLDDSGETGRRLEPIRLAAELEAKIIPMPQRSPGLLRTGNSAPARTLRFPEELA